MAIIDIVARVLAFIFVTGLGLILYFFKNPDKIDSSAALFWKIIDMVPIKWVRERSKFNVTASETQSRVNNVCKTIDDEAPGILPHSMKVEWVRNKEQVINYLEEGKCIVKLEYHGNQSDNLVRAARDHIKRSLTPKIKPHMDSKLREATELNVVKRICEPHDDIHAMDRFYDEYNNVIEEDPQVEEYSQSLQKIGQAGLFTRVFLNELNTTGERIQPEARIPSDQLKQNINDFSTEYLEDIAKKIIQNTDEDVELKFTRGEISTNIMLFIKSETQQQYGLDAHLRRIDTLAQEGVNSIYLLGLGSGNTGSTRQVAKRAERQGKVQIVREQSFRFDAHSGGRSEALCIETKTQPTSSHIDPEEEVRAAFEYEVPELTQGLIGIRKIAREPGHMSKVAVESRVPYIDVEECCRGISSNRLNAIKGRLDNEQVHLIIWSEDKKELLKRALFTSPEDYELEVEIDDGRAVVSVPANAVGSAVGREGNNVRLASKIAGFQKVVIEEKN